MEMRTETELIKINKKEASAIINALAEASHYRDDAISKTGKQLIVRITQVYPELYIRRRMYGSIGFRIQMDKLLNVDKY